MKRFAPLRTDHVIMAFVQAPGVLVAAAVAFGIYENPTLFELVIGLSVGAAVGGAGNGWLMWKLRRKASVDSGALSPLPEDAIRESTAEIRRYHLSRLPVYLAVDAAVIAVFAIIGAGLLLSITAMSVVRAWRIRAWEDRSNAVLFYERRKTWEQLRPQKPYWYYDRRTYEEAAAPAENVRELRA